MRKLMFFLGLMLLIGGTTAASTGEVHILDNPGKNDYVKYYLNGSVNGSSLESNINSSGLKVSLDSVKEEQGLTEVKFAVEIGENTGLFSRNVDLERLRLLNVSSADNFTVSYPTQIRIEGPLERIGTDFLEHKYRINRFEEEINYSYSKSSLYLSLFVMLAIVVVPFGLFRYYGRKVFESDMDKEEKVYKLNKSLALGSFPLMVVLLPAIFELGLISSSNMLLSSLMPFSGTNSSFAVIMAAVMVPVFGSIASAFLGIYPYIKELRDLEASKSKSLKKFFAAMGLMVIPILVWQFLVVNLSSSILSSLPFMLVAFGLFLLSLMALMPYMVMVLQSTKPLEGDLRENLESFCSVHGYELRDIKVIQAKGVKSANALFAGTIPGFNYVFITDYLIENFSKDEIEAVLAHELGHLEKNHIWIKGLAGFLFFGAWMTLVLKADFMKVLFQDFGFYGSVGTTFTLIMVYLVGVQGLLSSKLEYQADAYAKKLKGKEVTISALEKLAEANDMKKNTSKLFNLVNLHPSIEKRVERLEN